MARSGMSRLSQETLTIIGASIALAALILTSSAGIRGEIRDVRAEARADREAFQSHMQDVRAEARANREVFQSHMQDVRAEARANREVFQSHMQDVRAEARADRETFQSHIIRLTEQQGVLRARLDGLGAPPATDR